MQARPLLCHFGGEVGEERKPKVHAMKLTTASDELDLENSVYYH